VIVVLHNSASHLQECIASLPREAEVVVVDNDSKDDGVAIVRQLRPDARIVELTHNIGFGAGGNHGARAAQRELLLFVNPDTVLTDEAVDRLVTRVGRDAPAMVGPVMMAGAERHRANCRRSSHLHQDVIELIPYVARLCPQRWRRDLPDDDSVYVTGGSVEYLQGACFLVSRDIFEATGGFDEDFFLYQEEEVLAAKLRADGVRVILEPAAQVQHVGGTSTPSLVSSFHLYRSRILFYRKRDGDVRGLLAAIAIIAAAAVQVGALTLAIMRGRDVSDQFERLWALAKGCVAGLVAPATRPLPPSPG
jgi:N-acetylglucosaminyl-diphospho-decaprenol L-rhamnosyltransferase